MLDRATISSSDAAVLDAKAEQSRARRAVLRAQGICINGVPHGPATHGVLCERCRLVHRRGRGAAA